MTNEQQPTIYITRSPSRTSVVFITFQARHLHQEITNADVTIGEDGLVVHFREGGALPVKDNRLTLPPDMAWLFAPGRSKAAWLPIDSSTIILEVDR